MRLLGMPILALTALLLAGCTAQAWFEGSRTRQRQACYDLPAGQREKCLEQADLSYRDYQRARKERYQH